MVKLSIIVPYYKTFELTMELLKELSNQKTDEVEIFLIDDGCNEFEFDKFKDINVIHQENKGVSVSRNVGIKKAKGKYIAFIDSDDMITKDYIISLLELIDSRNEDIIYFNWMDKHTKEVICYPQNYAVWKAIYKKEIVPLFKENWHCNEDVPFQEEIREKEYSEFYSEKMLYIYNSNREGSLTWIKKMNR